jgi:hypothetical protein
MKNNTKNLLAALMLCLTFFACKKDKNETPVATSIVAYNNANFTLAEGAIFDYGASAVYGSINTHINYDFYLTDGKIEYSTTGEISDIKGKIAVYAELFSGGITGGFKTGTYNYIDETGDANLTAAQLKTKYENKQFFSYGFIVVGNDNINTSLGNAAEIEVKSGTIKVNGVSPNYSLEFDLLLTNDKTFKGTYNGKFTLTVD